MSHAHGYVIFPDGEKMFLEYDGTCDYARGHLFTTEEDVENQWRQPQEQRDCTCGGEEPIEVHVDYGDGIFFNSRGCRKCRVITGPRSWK